MPRFRILDPSSPAFSPIRDLPLTPDHLFSLENEPRRAPMPDDFVAEFSDRRVFVSDQEGGEPVSDFVRLGRSTGMLRVPRRSFLGRPGVEAEYREAPEVPGDIAASEPFRPDWSGYLYHPRSAAATRPSLRRADGQPMRAHNVYYPDNRRFFVPSDYPMQCIGRLNVFDNPSDMSRMRIGTATLVGPRTIVTAAHCMPRDGSPGKWGALFVPGYFNGISMVGVSSWCEAYRVATTVLSDATQAFDVAVMKLYDPLGSALGWFGSRTYMSDWEDEARWTLVGYPGYAADFASNAAWPTIEEAVRVIDDDPDGSFAEIEHMGDASDGNSGGPLFGTWPEGPYVIGVHSGDEYRTIWTPFGDIVAENNNVAAGGSGMVNMIRAALADWP
jgi:V8-like Glu-specific endopeptidase